MKFKTIVLEKKHLFAICAGIVLVCIGTGIAISAKQPKTIAVFSQNEEVYDEILSEGLPQGEEKNFIKEILDKLAGFDTQNPQSIITDKSPLFGEIKPTQIPTSEPQQEPEQPIYPQIADNAQYPTKSQIMGFSSVEVSNATDYQINSRELIGSELNFEIKKDGSPQILIVHTHTTESYGEFGDRNTDNTKNVVAVGAEMKKVLEDEGIGVIHDITVHDYPSYQGAYTRALATITKNLNQYPDIKIILDIHRDGYVYPDGTKLTKTTTINGESTAQVMIVSGTDSMGLDNPNWRENLKLGSKIQSAASIMYPTLMRPINLRRERFNLHLTTGSLLLEVGANGNSIEEAIRGGHYAAKAITAVIK